MNEIKAFLKTLNYSCEYLRQLERYEVVFLIERAEELGIKGMKEFLEKKDFGEMKQKRGRKIFEKTTGIVYKSSRELGEALGISPATALYRVKAHPEQYQIL